MQSLYDLMQSAESKAGSIKSIQRGTVAATTDGTAVTITAVDTAKAVVNVASARAVNDTVVLTNATTITVTTSTNGDVNWQVVEYY